MITKLVGTIVDPVAGEFFFGELRFENGRIISQQRLSGTASGPVITPGLVDAHVHVESSMLVPSQFARLAVRHGTVATVSDPHEIANVCGLEGIEYMIADGKRVPFKFYFGAPSCVPATSFESAGAEIRAEDVAALLQRPEVLYLAEMMNWPGVLNGDSEVLAKIAAALRLQKRIDGHAPGLRGDQARKYAASGMTTDHECFTLEEARDKVAAGMKIAIREGSAAKNFAALIPLLEESPEAVMFCTDDAHPDYLRDGHINRSISRAINAGYNAIDVVRAATLNPVRHYGLEVGLLQLGDPADITVFQSLESGDVLETYIEGELVAQKGESLLPQVAVDVINHFAAEEIEAGQIKLFSNGSTRGRVIGVLPGQLITEERLLPLHQHQGEVVPDTARDILKLVVVNRYLSTPPAIALVQGFNLKCGALASSVAHDSHNIVAVGCSDEEIAAAINGVIRHRGGLALQFATEATEVLPLEIAGLMSRADAFTVASRYEELDQKAKSVLGSTLPAPYMALSFLALLVIPSLKLSDKGLFDGSTFRFVPLLVT